MIIGLFDVSLGNEERIMILDFFRKQDKIFLMQFEAYIKLRKFDSGTKIISTVMQHLHRAMILREDTSEIPIWLRAVLLWMVVVVVMVLIHKEDPRMWLWMINANEYVGFPIHIHFLRRIHTRSEGTLARNAADGQTLREYSCRKRCRRAPFSNKCHISQWLQPWGQYSVVSWGVRTTINANSSGEW